MSRTPNRVAIDHVDWSSVLPILRLAGAFRNALQLGKLAVALAAVVLIHLTALALNYLWGDQVAYFGEKIGVYETFIRAEGQAFDRLVNDALSLKLGIGSESVGVFDALRDMFVNMPASLFREYPWFTLVFGSLALLVLSISSGIICRMSATQVCKRESISLPRAVRFVKQRWAWYVLTPLMPTLLVLVAGLVLIGAGLLLFNLPVLDVVGSLAYGLMLVLGVVMALVTLLLIFGMFLFAPALSVEGSDGFDAISRSFNYVMFRPWHYAGYLLGSVVYLAVVFVLLSTLAGLGVSATNSFTGTGVFAGVSTPAETGLIHSSEAELSRFEQITMGNPMNVGGTVGVSTWIVGRWVDLLSALVAAVMFSVICCLQTQVYVLMRYATDTTALDDCAADEEPGLWSTPQTNSALVANADSAAKPQVTPPAEPVAEPGNDSQADAPEQGGADKPTEG